MLGVHPGLEEDGLEDDRGQAEEPRQVGHQTHDYHFVHAVDVG